MKMYPTTMEITNDDNTLAATLVTFDEYTATVRIVECLHTEESWRELSTLIENAFQKLELEKEN